MTSTIKFHKMHGLGNDFVIIEAITQKVNLNKIDIKSIADRNLGIGFDQLLFIQNSEIGDFSCDIYNSDGSSAIQCGNGMRCIAKFLYENGFTKKNEILIETQSQVISAKIYDANKISINMGKPSFNSEIFEIAPTFTDKNFKIYTVSIGNPHAIIFVDTFEESQLKSIINSININQKFPAGINLGFVKINNENNVALKTVERGAGNTLACGSNACAAAAVAIKYKNLSNNITISLAHGTLDLTWMGKDSDPIIMEGPASYVFAGEILV